MTDQEQAADPPEYQYWEVREIARTVGDDVKTAEIVYEWDPIGRNAHLREKFYRAKLKPFRVGRNPLTGEDVFWTADIRIKDAVSPADAFEKLPGCAATAQEKLSAQYRRSILVAKTAGAVAPKLNR